MKLADTSSTLTMQAMLLAGAWDETSRGSATTAHLRDDRAESVDGSVPYSPFPPSSKDLYSCSPSQMQHHTLFSVVPQSSAELAAEKQAHVICVFPTSHVTPGQFALDVQGSEAVLVHCDDQAAPFVAVWRSKSAFN